MRHGRAERQERQTITNHFQQIREFADSLGYDWQKYDEKTLPPPGIIHIPDDGFRSAYQQLWLEHQEHAFHIKKLQSYFDRKHNETLGRLRALYLRSRG
jgi:hypothetical protein